jgi:aminopeptidase N
MKKILNIDADARREMMYKILLGMIMDYEDLQDHFFLEEFLKLYAEVFSGGATGEFPPDMFVLPSEEELAERCEVINPEAIHQVLKTVRSEIAARFYDDFMELYKNNHPSKYAALNFMRASSSVPHIRRILDLLWTQLVGAGNVRDDEAALQCLVHMPYKSWERPDDEESYFFYNKWKHDAAAVDSWFRAQATCPLLGTIDRVRELMEKHPAFSWNNQNRVRALILSFANENMAQFHQRSAEGYELLGDAIVVVDTVNQEMAIELMEPFMKWKRYEEHWRELMKNELVRLSKAKLSAGVTEKAIKSLAF